MKTKSRPETEVKKIMPEKGKPAEKKVYEKPELTAIDLLDESARGWSEPPPPDGNNDYNDYDGSINFRH